MAYNVLSLCENKGAYFEVDPAVMFPATIKRIQAVLFGDETPSELSKAAGNPWRDPVVMQFLKPFEALPEPNWDTPTADALALAESWFERALALHVGKGIRVPISKNFDYKKR